ncbi:MAG: MBL fold metallo-hydrolase [Dorea longicatena]
MAQLDYVFLSHGDLDHMNGIEELPMRPGCGSAHPEIL